MTVLALLIQNLTRYPMAGYGTHYCRPSWPQTSGRPSASASLALGRWGFASEFSGPLPEAPQTLREECMRGWGHGIQPPLYTGTEDDSLQGLEKKSFCKLKTSIYPVSGVFCNFFPLMPGESLYPQCSVWYKVGNAHLSSNLR